MEVLNKKERLISFLLFISLFLITVVIIVVSVFFNFHLPWRENEELKKENASMINEFRFQSKFEEQMELLKKYIDSIDMPNQDTYYYQQKSVDMVIKMEQNIPSQDSVRRGLLYKNFLLTSRSLIDSKKTIKTYGKSKAEIDTLLAKVEAYRKQIEIMKRDLDICRMLNRKD
ncbi:type VI secretion system TssO [Apibacter raozihei]|uniref:type VI secretion system TssO n=1 Tax=Apibacter TaxID=1778601 RepID=UPI000FE3A77D|nr:MULTISPECIES: type VI secretion system TssO [Apibacter]